ncbi:TRAP transporter small permease [Skermanella mucosa]|uniref:TRAP transporter small permease n=1 Tax=Skermanella mucosa TaxID=1789672 RepID=UPI00192C3BBA|nr:TRAP transporter small permease [Skermanella mucosa]UEM19171.1 TRAP transporter small permease [Skermanella mucosa]
MVELVGAADGRTVGQAQGNWLRRAIANLEETAASAALVIVVLSVCWGVLSRYVTQQPAAWSGEVAAIAFAWVVFLGAAAGFKRGLHVSIDMLVTLLPPRPRRILDLGVELLLVAFCLYMVWLGISFVVANWENPTSVLRLSSSIVYAAVPVGFGLMAMRIVQRAVGALRGPLPEQAP